LGIITISPPGTGATLKVAVLAQLVRKRAVSNSSREWGCFITGWG